MFVCMCVCVLLCLYVCVRVCVSVFECVYVCVCVYKICKYNGLHWQQKDINNSLSEVKKLMVYMYFSLILKYRVVEGLSVYLCNVPKDLSNC